MSVGQKLTMLKIRSTRVTFLSLSNLEAAPEEAMQLRRLIKSSNESLGPYLFGKIEFWNFLGPTAEIPGDSTSKSPHGIGLNQCTLVYRIDVHARLLILRKKSTLYGLILDCTFIDFEEKFPPARLFHPARLLILVIH